jgi:hypothetical protein
MQYLARNGRRQVRYALRKQKAVRVYRRWVTVSDVDEAGGPRIARSRHVAGGSGGDHRGVTLRSTTPSSRRCIAKGDRDDAGPARAQATAGFGFIDGPLRGL